MRNALIEEFYNTNHDPHSGKFANGHSGGHAQMQAREARQNALALVNRARENHGMHPIDAAGKQSGPAPQRPSTELPAHRAYRLWNETRARHAATRNTTPSAKRTKVEKHSTPEFIDAAKATHSTGFTGLNHRHPAGVTGRTRVTIKKDSKAGQIGSRKLRTKKPTDKRSALDDRLAMNAILAKRKG